MLDGIERLDDSGTPSGQLEAFQDMVSLRVGPGQAVEESERAEGVSTRPED